MRVLFVITGFGFGDSIRSECIINEIIKNKKNKVMILGYDFSYEYFKKKFKILKIQGYKFPDYGLEFKTSEFLIKNVHLPLAWLITIAKNIKEIRKFNPDIVVSDFEPVANLIARKIGKKCISIFGYDIREYSKIRQNPKLRLQAKYIERVYKNSDLVLIPSFNKKKNLGNIIYVNPIIRKYKQKEKKKLMGKLGLKKEPIVVMLGGSNYGMGLAKRIKEFAKEIDENFIFFGGKKALDNKHFRGFNRNYLEYLTVSKGIITLGGMLSLSEGLYFKKPMLVFPIKNHVEQILNSMAVKKYAYVGDEKKLKKCLFNFINNLDKHKKMANNANIKFNGEKEIVEILEKIT